ncbi:helix-turn-helix domain-containing protein [Faecalibaculum rodentium]|uniref:helix-turn-helix domain-containing protein n=1 Tax=Faecalibaculum rodentium TaxID=1702221 RepID=UPI0025A65446|nr:helix-turn-helix transcriptional regulator [Faecalibaculum rodentium]
MGLRYKKPLPHERLKEAGYSSYFLTKQKNIFSMGTMTKFRNGEMVSCSNLERLCRLLNCQPGDLIEFVPDTDEKSPVI